LVDWDLLAFGASIIEIGRCINNLELELIFHAVHVSVCWDYCEVPDPEILPQRRIIGQDPTALVDSDEFIGYLREYYDKYRIIFLICVGRYFVGD
jgi:hypothetical protein